MKPNPNMTYEELREQLESLNIKISTQGGEISSYLANESIDELIQLFATLCAEVIGEDLEIWGTGTDDERRAINYSKADQRTRLAQLTTKNTEEK